MIEDTGTDLTFGFPYAASREVESSLRRLARGEASRSGVWPVLVRSKVYLRGAGVCLDESGFRLELPVREDGGLRVVHVYTSRATLPDGTREEEVVSVPFSLVLPEVPPWVSVVFDPGASGELILSPVELLRIRRKLV